MKRYKNLINLLNLNYLHYANKSVSKGSMDIPAICCNAEIFPDFIALYSETGLYHKTDRTAVGFFQYDDDFDGKDGLWWAIYYNDEKRLAYFKERFKGVKYVIVPDYSELGDIHKIENDYRLFRGSIVGLWFMFEIGAVVLPNITFPTIESCESAIKRYEGSSVVLFSTKGHMDDPEENKRLRENICLTVDKMPEIKTILAYDICSTNDATFDTFSYAAQKGIKIIIPDNTLKTRNMEMYRERHTPRKAVV